MEEDIELTQEQIEEQAEAARIAAEEEASKPRFTQADMDAYVERMATAMAEKLKPVPVVEKPKVQTSEIPEDDNDILDAMAATDDRIEYAKLNRELASRQVKRATEASAKQFEKVLADNAAKMAEEQKPTQVARIVEELAAGASAEAKAQLSGYLSSIPAGNLSKLSEADKTMLRSAARGMSVTEPDATGPVVSGKNARGAAQASQQDPAILKYATQMEIPYASAEKHMKAVLARK